MKHLRTVSVAKASTNVNLGGNLSLGYLIWLASMYWVIKRVD